MSRTNLISRIFALVAILLPVQLQALTITPSAALQRLGEWKPGAASTRSQADRRLLKTITAPDGTPTIYIFTYNGDDGFLILSANDAALPVLGYSESDHIDISNLPFAFEGQMQTYSAEIAAIPEDAPVYKPATGTRAATHEPVEPLVKTKWDQLAPYNDQCPVYSQKRTLTGCVATGMAQVMNYWKYPAVGQGEKTYWCAGIRQTLSIDFSEIEFDWEHMRNSYSGSYSATEGRAVATLMKACGYSVQMAYSLTNSGAYPYDIPGAFKNYFGYDTATTFATRTRYSADAWDNLIYSSIGNGIPVIYGGSGDAGGHCFICDGYDGNGYYHINWGWGGVSDGYYTLDDLTPGQIGAGGFPGGFNKEQNALLGLTPPSGRLSIIQSPVIENASPDSGNMANLGYVYRINDYRDIRLAMTLGVSGGYISSPVIVTIYEKDPVTGDNVEKVYESTSLPFTLYDGETTDWAETISLDKFDGSKMYFLTVAYLLKGQKNIIGSLTFAADSGVDGITGDQAEILIARNGDLLAASGDGVLSLSLLNVGGVEVAKAQDENPQISLSGLPGGAYIAVASDSAGHVKRLKLLI